MTTAAVHLSHAQPRHGARDVDVVQDAAPQGSPEAGSQKPTLVDSVPILAVNAEAAAEMVGLAKRSWLRRHSAAECPQPIRIGRSVRWRTSDLRLWVEWGCPSRSRFEELKQARERARARAGR